MNIYLDNIIFSLQKSGGASVLWQQHIQRLINDDNFECKFLEYDTAQLNLFRNLVSIDPSLIELKKSKLLRLERYLNLNKPFDKHIFHSSHYRVNNTKGAINVTTVHDFTYEYFIKGFSTKVHSYQKNQSIVNAQGIVCVSESTKRDMLRFLPNIDKNRIRVIYNGVDESFKPLSTSIKFDVKHSFVDYQYLIYVGDRKNKYKNFNLALEASSIVNMPLLIIGGGLLNKLEIESLNNKIGINNYCQLTNVSVFDLNFYYNRAFCLLYPSLYEGFGIPVIEAQRAGCPVIATYASSIPEVIGSNYTAIKDNNPIKTASLIQELSLGSNLRSEVVEIGLEKANFFSWDKTYEETSNFYKELYFGK